MKRFGEETLSLEYLSASQFNHENPNWRDSVLGGACFGRHAASRPDSGLPLLCIEMQTGCDGETVFEIWHSNELLSSGSQGDIRYRYGENLLFGCLSLDETLPEISEDAVPPLQQLSKVAYQEIFSLLEILGFSSVLRFWNYFPAINQESHAMERYRQFNIGRQDAFLSQGRSLCDSVPAACALGSAGRHLQIAFLASRSASTSIENPRQVSAYHYPSQYGPRSPSFSRAGLVNLAGKPVLFISGTASIVGHLSVHIDDVAAQTRESLRNIDWVLEQANHQAPEAGFCLADLAYKVYVRHLEDMPVVRQEMERYIGAAVPTVYLQADVCRAELLVEIEASGGHAMRINAPLSC